MKETGIRLVIGSTEEENTPTLREQVEAAYKQITEIREGNPYEVGIIEGYKTAELLEANAEAVLDYLMLATTEEAQTLARMCNTLAELYAQIPDKQNVVIFWQTAARILEI